MMACGNEGPITYFDYPNNIDDNIDTIEVEYISWACACANWVDYSYLISNSYISEDKLAENCFFIEAEKDSIRIPDSYFADTNNYRIQLIGSYYKDKGISRDYIKPTSEKPEHARVFRYSQFKIIKPEVIQNNFIGAWRSVDRATPYRSYLIIEKDSSFHFNYGVCMNYGFSNGKWIMSDTSVMLSSIDIDSCLYINHFGETGIIIVLETDSNSIKEGDSNYIKETTIPDCKPITIVDFVVFSNEEFYIDSDTLKHVIKEKNIYFKTRNKFIRIEKEKTDKLKITP